MVIAIKMPPVQAVLTVGLHSTQHVKALAGLIEAGCMSLTDNVRWIQVQAVKRVAFKRANRSNRLASPVHLPAKLLEPPGDIATNSAGLDAFQVKLGLCHDLCILAEKGIDVFLH